MLRLPVSVFLFGLIASGLGGPARGQSRYGAGASGAAGNESSGYGGYGNTSGGSQRGAELNTNYQRQAAPYAPPYGQRTAQGRQSSGPATGSTRQFGPTRQPVYTAQVPNGTRAGGSAVAPQGPGGPAGNTSGSNPPFVDPTRQNRAGAAAGTAPGAARVAPGRPLPIRAPFAPLNTQQQKYIDTLLNYWEFSTKNIERYQCTFQLWRYDPVFGPKDSNVPVEFSEGVIKYEAPDRGLYKVEKSKLYRPPEKEGEEPEWKDTTLPGDHWVCDGKSLFEFDWNRKLMIKRDLPPNVQGVHIANGPLPFLLKAKAAQVKARFWVRGIRSPRPNEYWVEAFPKRRSDAANFQKLHIVLNEKYLPKALVVFNPGFRPDRPARTTYEFANIDPNPNKPWFGQQFVVASAPGLDWRTVEQPVPGGGGPAAPPQQTRRP